MFTVVIGVLSFFVVPDFPDRKSRWLTERERHAVLARLAADKNYSAKGEGFDVHNIWKAMLDIKTLIAMWLFASINAPIYSFSTFGAVVIHDLFPHRSPTFANLVSIPLFVWVCVFVMLTGYFTARYQRRVQVELVFLSVGIVGYIVLIAAPHPVVRYVFLFMAGLGSFPLIPNTLTLCSQVEGSLKRGTAMGVFVGFGNVLGAGTIAAYGHPGADRTFRLGHGIALLFYVSGICATLTYWYVCVRENNLRDRGLRDEIIIPATEYPNYQDRLRMAAEAQRRREHAIATDPSSNRLARFIRLARAKTHSLPGGTYASVEQARELKGDDWSGYRYQT